MKTTMKTKKKPGPARRILTNLGWLALGAVFLGGAVAAVKTGNVTINPDQGSSYTATRTGNPIAFWAEVAGGLVLGGLIVVAKLHTIVTEVWGLMRGTPSGPVGDPVPSAADLERLQEFKRFVKQLPGEERSEQEDADKRLVSSLRSPDEIPAFEETTGRKSFWGSAYHFAAFGSYKETAKVGFGLAGGGRLSIGRSVFEVRSASPFSNDWTLQHNGEACAHGSVKHYGMMDQMRDAVSAMDEEAILPGRQEEETTLLASSSRGEYCNIEADEMCLSLVPSPFGNSDEERAFCILANGAIVGSICKHWGAVGLLGGRNDRVSIQCSSSVPEHLQLFLVWLAINPHKLSPGLTSLMEGLGNRRQPQPPYESRHLQTQPPRNGPVFNPETKWSRLS